MNDRNLRVQGAIGELSLTRPTLTPLQEAAAGDIQYLAKSRNRLPAGLCFDPGVLHRDSLAKCAAAFFRISLSTLAEANSRRNRSFSASSSFADRGVAVTATEESSFPARSSFTQLDKLDSGMRSRRLASVRPTLLPNRTASILNSLVYRRLGTPTFL